MELNPLLTTTVSKTESVEKTLIRMLIDRYQRFGLIGRPVIDNKNVLKVRYGLQLIQILNLDENKQILHTNCWSNYNWNDTLLRWNPAEHGNITEVRIFPSQVWTPDIQLYNFADQRSREHRIARVVVHADGNILWVPQALFKSACQVEITFFPFDTQIIIEGMGRLMLVRQGIPFPEEKKTLSHVVARTTGSGVVTGLGGTSGGVGRGSRRRKVRVPELLSDKFLEDYDDVFETADGDGYFNNSNTFSYNNNESSRRQPFGPVANCADGADGWNHMAAAGNRTGYSAHAICPVCMGFTDSVGDLSHHSAAQDWRGGSQFPEVIRGEPSANAPNLELEDSPIMLSSSTSLERDVREVKRYMRMFVNRQKEGARKNAIAMEWRTMAMILDRFFFFVYIATIGITVITAMPRKHRPEGLS
ncbi:hypothetical protein Aperf_G00000015731 [Anoplocephala perfoliata]